MLKIKYIPNILSKEGREEYDLKYFRGKKVLDYISECKLPVKEIRIVVSGKVITDYDTFVKNNDEIIVLPEIKVGVIVGAISWVVESWAVIQTVLTVATIAYTVYSMFASPRKPSFNSNGSGIDEGSPTYGWDGIVTTQDVGIPVAVLFGDHDFGGNIINVYVRTDGDKNYLNVLLGVSEGEIENIYNLRINGNPSANFDNITTTTRLGTNSQTVIPNFEDAHNLYSVGVNLTKDNPHAYTTADSDVEAFEIYLQLSSGLYQQGSDGSIAEWSVTYKVEYKLHAAPAYTDLGSTTITAKSRTAVRRVYRKVDLVAGQYDIKVTKTSDDSTLSPLKQGDLTWSQVDEIKTDDYEYPNTALLAIEALATDQLSGSIPNFTFTVKGKKVSAPYVLNGSVQVDWEDYYWDDANTEFRLLSGDTPLTWDGVTYADQYCGNPIWCTKDLLINTRYGLGEFIESIDINSTIFLEMAKYCEEKVPDGEGSYEKRFILNIVLDSTTPALDMISQICSVFRGIPFYSGGAIQLRIDKEETPAQLFTMGNILKGSFKQSWKSNKDVPNVLEIQYLDKDQDYKQETIAYMDDDSIEAGDPVRVKQVKMFATNISQVLREARYNMKVATNIKRTCALGVSVDSLACQAGDVISISHDVPQWGYSGRVKVDSTTSTVNVDQTLTIAESTNYSIQVKLSDDTIEERVVTNSPGEVSAITVSVPFSSAPAAYDNYIFGETTNLKKDWRVLAIQRGFNNEAELIVIEYLEDVYDDTAVDLPINNFSSLVTTPSNVNNLNLTERLVTLADGTIENAIDIWWDKATIVSSNYIKTFYKALIYISENNTDWRFVGESFGNSFSITDDIVAGETYYITVITETLSGQAGDFGNSPTDNITITGNPPVPADVSTFASNFDIDLILTWAKNVNKDIAGYEIRDLNNSWGVDNGNLVYRGAVNSYTYQPSSRAPGTLYIKAYNTTELYSDTAASLTPTNTAPAAPTVTPTMFFNVSTLDWNDSADPDLVYYEIYKSNTNAWAGEEALYSKVSGVSSKVQGNIPVDAVADSTSSTTMVDATLIGKGVDYFVGDRIKQTSGTYSGQEETITAFNNTTGAITVASWTSGTPTAADKFVLKDRAYFKVRGVDLYGVGTFSTASTIDFSPLTESEIGENIITAGKLTTGELITLSAQIKDAIITDAKIFNLDADKIDAGTITADKYGELRNTYVYNSSDSLDSSYPFEVPFKIVSELEDIVSVKLSFSISEFRAYSTAASSGGGSTSGSTLSGSHTHQLTFENTTSGSLVRFNGTTLYNLGGGTANIGPHTVTLSAVSDGDYLEKTGNQLFCDGYGGTFTTSSNAHDGIPAHSHTFTVVDSDIGETRVEFYNSHDTFSIDPVGDVGSIQSDFYLGSHTHTTPAHTHDITYGIYEDSQSPTINVYIDNGAGFGASIGAYTEDQTDINISASITGTGWKKIRFTTDDRCRVHSIIECKLDIAA